MPQLDPEYYISQLFWLALCFGVLYIVMRYIALPKAVSILTKREQFILEGLARAEKLRDAVDTLTTELAAKSAENRKVIESEYKSAMAAETLKIKNSIVQLNKKLFAQEMKAEQHVYQTLREDEAVNHQQSRVIASIILTKILGKDVEIKNIAKSGIRGK